MKMFGVGYKSPHNLKSSPANGGGKFYVRLAGDSKFLNPFQRGKVRMGGK
jgi:hypothetical protein